MIDVLSLDETGNIINIGESEAAVGGTCGKLVKLLDNGRASEGEKKRCEGAALSQACRLGDFNRGPVSGREGDVCRFAKNDSEPRDLCGKTSRGFHDQSFSV